MLHVTEIDLEQPSPIRSKTAVLNNATLRKVASNLRLAIYACLYDLFLPLILLYSALLWS